MSGRIAKKVKTTRKRCAVNCACSGEKAVGWLFFVAGHPAFKRFELEGEVPRLAAPICERCVDEVRRRAGG